MEAALAALYLRGAPRPADPPRRGWPAIVAALRRERAAADPAGVLRKEGMTLAATLLDTPGLLEWAQDAVDAGAVLTAVSPGYPLRWFEALGDLAPPALWRSGEIAAIEWIGAVGSRAVEAEVQDYMAGVGARSVALGRGVVSGGAVGCDTVAEGAALAAGGPVLRLLPHGLALRPADDGAANVALAAPSEPFTRALAMERNLLIYAAAEATVVGHARMRQGGTWHGATEALRRKVGRILIRPDGSAAARTLRALGAEEMADPAQLKERLDEGPPRRSLFAYERPLR